MTNIVHQPVLGAAHPGLVEDCALCAARRGPATPDVDPARPATREWRVGRHYPVHVYEGDTPVATFFTAQDAERAVQAVNTAAVPTPDVDHDETAEELREEVARLRLFAYEMQRQRIAVLKLCDSATIPLVTQRRQVAVDDLEAALGVARGGAE